MRTNTVGFWSPPWYGRPAIKASYARQISKGRKEKSARRPMNLPSPGWRPKSAGLGMIAEHRCRTGCDKPALAAARRTGVGKSTTLLKNLGTY